MRPVPPPPLDPHGTIMDWHVVLMLSQSNAASATQDRVPLVGGQAHGTRGAIVATVMLPQPPLRRPAVDYLLLLGSPPPVGNSDGNMVTLTPIPGAPSALRLVALLSSFFFQMWLAVFCME